MYWFQEWQYSSDDDSPHVSSVQVVCSLSNSNVLTIHRTANCNGSHDVGTLMNANYRSCRGMWLKKMIADTKLNNLNDLSNGSIAVKLISSSIFPRKASVPTVEFTVIMIVEEVTVHVPITKHKLRLRALWSIVRVSNSCRQHGSNACAIHDVASVSPFQY